MDLTETQHLVERSLAGSDSFLVENSDRLKIIAGDIEVYNEKVPNNKKWRVEITLKIQEADESAEI